MNGEELLIFQKLNLEMNFVSSLHNTHSTKNVKCLFQPPPQSFVTFSFYGASRGKPSMLDLEGSCKMTI